MVQVVKHYWLRPAVAAETIGVSRWTVKRWGDRGILRYIVRHNGHREYFSDDVLLQAAIRGRFDDRRV